MIRLTRALAAFLLAVALPGTTIAQSPSQSPWPASRPPAPLTARPVSFPPYQLKTLSNGLQVLVVLHHEQPSVYFRLLVRAGSVQEPASKPGVASFVASLLNQGTTTKSSGQIATTVDSAGGLLGTGSLNELSYVNGAVIKDQVDLMLATASDLVQNPAFAPEEIERQRNQMYSALKVGYDDPDYVADMVFERLVYGFHPYGRPNQGTPESIGKITRDDLVAYHRAWFVPNNALLAIVGDLTAAEAFAAAEKAFGGWARRDVPDVKTVEPPPPARRVVIVDRPGSAQTEIRVGHLAMPRTHPEFVPFDLTMRVLGGEGANRLFGVLRSDRGLTYGASAELHSFKASGNIVAETDTRSPATGQALRLMVDEVSRIQREPVGAGELRGAQDYLSGSFPLTIESPSAIAQQVLMHLFYGLDLKEIETYRDQVERVTPADIQRVARQFLKPEQLSIVLVGDASVFIEQLKAMGFADFERIPIGQLDLNAPSLRRGTPPPPHEDPPPA
jgi:zinc protease